jgi:hypothetical protein
MGSNPSPHVPPDRRVTRSSKAPPALHPPTTEQLNTPAPLRSNLRSNPPQKTVAVNASEPQNEAEEPSEPSSTSLLTIAEALEKLINNYQMNEILKDALGKIARFANKTGVKESKSEIIQVTMEDVRALRKDLMTDIFAWQNTIEEKIGNLANSQQQILKATESITKEAKGINAAAKEIEDKVTKVNATTDQIASTTRTYKDALTTQSNRPTGTTTDLKLADSLERKAKQILMIVHSDDLGGKSLAEIRDKANNAIAEIHDPLDRPDKVEVLTVTFMRNKAILLQMNSKQASNWLRDVANEVKFVEKFAKDTYFVDRNYNIIVPRTPIIFDPKSEAYLHEVEEGNNLDRNSIRKARWIKPVDRRREGQTHAYAVLTLTSPSAANQLIRNGITICGAKSSPTKLKHEPMQCLRCRGWGHLIAQCLNANDTCGACGEGHNTRDCSNANKRFCTSCRANTHASWDRNCPEFIRRCEDYNVKFPENKLPFFPTDEEWTHTPRPDRIPMNDRFPQRYAVNSLPTATATKRSQQQNHTRNKDKRQGKQPATSKRTTQDGGDNNHIEKYFTRSQPLASTSSIGKKVDVLLGLDYTEETESYRVEQLIGDTAPTSQLGWN